MKRVLKAALVFLPFVLCMMLVNYYADPANVLRSEYETRAAQILASGENAANLRDMDDRAFMKAYLPLRTQPIDTLVLGSSHCMQVTKELTGDENTFCAGMTGADLRDCISVYRLARENGFAPKRVILTVDYWFWSENTFEGRAMTEGYADFCKEHGFEPFSAGKSSQLRRKIERKLQLISIPYFQSGLDFLKKGMHKTRWPVATTAHDAESAMRRADGSYGYAESYRNGGTAASEHYARDSILVKPYSAVNFSGVSKELMRQLTAFLDEMQQQGVQVAVMLTPYHPVYYEYMTQQTDNYRDILATEDLMRSIAQEKNIPVIGSYDPAECGLSGADFYDAIHCTEQAMYRFYPEDLF